MQSALIWTAIIAFSLYRYRQQNPALKKSIYRKHALCSWLLLIMNHTAFKNVGWAIANHAAAREHFFKPMGELPAEVNFAVWILWTVFGAVAMILALVLARGNARAMEFTAWLAPVLGLIAAMDFFRHGTEPPGLDTWIVVLMAIFSIGFAGAIYGSIWRFYSNRDVRALLSNEISHRAA